MFARKSSVLFITIFNVCIFGTIEPNDGGITFPCNTFGCESNQVCVLEEVVCVSDPCPKLPNCIKSSSVCKGNKPLLDPTGGAVTCENSCPLPHECVEGFCCPTAEMPPLTSTVVTSTEIVILPGKGGILPNILDVKTGKPTEKPCSPCQMSLCFTATCNEPSDVHCVQDNCSCAMWFADNDGIQVECLDDRVNDDPFPFLNIEGTPITLEPTETSKTLASHGGDPQGKHMWKYPVFAICGTAVICAIAFSVYKVMIRRRQQRQDNLNIEEEQKVPLKQVSPTENNNDAKLSKTITAGPPEVV